MKKDRKRPAKQRSKTSLRLPFEGFGIARPIDWSDNRERIWVGPKVKRGRPIFFRLSLILTGLFLLTLIWFSFYFYQSYQAGKNLVIADSHQELVGYWEQYFGPSAVSDLEPTNRPSDYERFTVLIAGRGGGDHPAPNLTDSLQIVSFDFKEMSGTVLSIPRDLYVEDPFSSVATEDPLNPDLLIEPPRVKINSIYQRGLWASGDNSLAAQAFGMKVLEKTIEEKFGLAIDGYILIDFAGFLKTIEIIAPDGLKIDIPVAVNDELSGSYLAAGRQVISQEQALAYSRARQTIAGGDFGRSGNQRRIMIALAQQTAADNSIKNLFKIKPVLAALEGNFLTNIDDFSQIRELYNQAGLISEAKIESLDLVSKERLLQAMTINTGSLESPQPLSIVVPVAGIDDYQAIKDHLAKVFALGNNSDNFNEAN